VTLGSDSRTDGGFVPPSPQEVQTGTERALNGHWTGTGRALDGHWTGTDRAQNCDGTVRALNGHCPVPVQCPIGPLGATEGQIRAISVSVSVSDLFAVSACLATNTSHIKLKMSSLRISSQPPPHAGNPLSPDTRLRLSCIAPGESETPMEASQASPTSDH